MHLSDSEREQLFRELSLLRRAICKPIGDPKRLMILYALHEQPRYVGELADALGFPQPTVSRHLAMLLDAGLVARTRQGQTVTYRLRDERIIQAIDLMRLIMRDAIQDMLPPEATAPEVSGECGDR